jgi:hypothetical protein
MGDRSNALPEIAIFVVYSLPQSSQNQHERGKTKMPIPIGNSVPYSVPSKSQPLPPSVQHKYEAEFGADLSQVTLHESHVPTLKGAKSYTMGNEIHFPPGSLNPHSEEGQNVLGHELAHVVQQNGNPSGSESVFQSLAQEAENMATRAAQFFSE